MYRSASHRVGRGGMRKGEWKNKFKHKKFEFRDCKFELSFTPYYLFGTLASTSYFIYKWLPYGLTKKILFTFALILEMLNNKEYMITKLELMFKIHWFKLFFFRLIKPVLSILIRNCLRLLNYLWMFWRHFAVLQG